MAFAQIHLLHSSQNAFTIQDNSHLTYRNPTYIHNMTFHELTDNNTTPPAAKSVLGLGIKFIQTPKYTTSDISATLA